MGVKIGSDNPFPSILLKETAAPASPAAGEQRLFVDPADHAYKTKNAAGVVSALGGGGGGSSLEIAEVDSAPDVVAVTKILVPNGSLTDDGGGQVTLAATGVALSDETPIVEAGAGDPGTGGEAARDDHVHPASGGGGGASSPLVGDAVSGDQGGAVKFADGVGSGTGGEAALHGGYANGHSDRPGGYVIARGGTANFGGIEIGVGDSEGGASNRPRMVWSGSGGGLAFIHPGAVTFSNDEGDLTFSLAPYGGSTLILNLPRLPVADPHVVGQVWNNGGVMTISAG